MNLKENIVYSWWIGQKPKANPSLVLYLEVFKEARKGFSLHARAQSTHAITKMYASAK